MTETIPAFYERPGLHVEIYDVQTAAGWGAQGDLDFYREEARASGGPVLELACGTGRLAIPLLDTGQEIHGLDASAAMLAEARRKREALPAETARRLHLHAGDMERFRLGQKFALILIAFRSFQILLTSEAQRACLGCLRDHLAPGGRAILNLFDPRYDLLLPGRREGDPPREFVHPRTGNPVRIETVERVNEPVTQTFRELWRFTETAPDSRVLRREEERLCLRWTFRHEMRHLAAGCGLAAEAEYSDFHRSPPAYGKEQVWVLRAA